MDNICKFCNKRDFQPHVPSLSLDLEKAIESGTIVPTELTVDDFNHLDIDNVQNASRIRDTFDAIEYGASLKNYSNQFSSGTGNNLTPMSTPTPAGEGSAN